MKRRMIILTSIFLVISILFSVIVGCRNKEETEKDTNKNNRENNLEETEVLIEEDKGDEKEYFKAFNILKKARVFSYTNINLNGNKVLPFDFKIRNTKTLDIKIGGKPLWLLSASLGEGSIWVAILEDGRVQAFQVTDEAYEEIDIIPKVFRETAPPVLFISDNSPYLIDRQLYETNFLTHPVVDVNMDFIVTVTNQGDLIIYDGIKKKIDIEVLIDSRIIFDKNGIIYTLTDPSSVYKHGILGDDIEATSVTLIDPENDFKSSNIIKLSEGEVIETLFPLVSDIDGDLIEDIFVTISNNTSGAKISVFNNKGILLAEGPPIGKPKRWRHLLAVAPFGPDKEIELVDVLTPHIGGIVEFYRLSEGELKIVAQKSGYSSHKIGSRNLDMALAGDFDSDGQFELMVPDDSFKELAVVKHNIDGIEEIWRNQIGDRMCTNISAAFTYSGKAHFGVGREDGFLRIWIEE